MLKHPVIATELFEGYLWALVIEGICPFCRVEMSMNPDIYIEYWSSSQCPKCLRVYIESIEHRRKVSD